MAFLAPLILFTCTYGIAWGAGIRQLNLSNSPTLLDLLILLVTSTIFGVAEEINWRGYLLPHLVPLGRKRALLLSGLLHGIWPLPVLLMTST
jgi:membrane protease YdiL (CAAX protease family)